jgi:hypothetical protein
MSRKNFISILWIGLLFTGTCLWLSIRFLPTFQSEKIALDVRGDYPPFDWPEIHEIAQKPFRYLGKGFQATAFVSDDGRYVIKFFATRKPPAATKFAPPAIRRFWPPYESRRRCQYAKKNRARTTQILANYKRAYELFREESALLAVHLGATCQNLPVCTVFDEKGRAQRIDLNRASFIVQKWCLPLEKIVGQPDLIIPILRNNDRFEHVKASEIDDRQLQRSNTQQLAIVNLRELSRSSNRSLFLRIGITSLFQDLIRIKATRGLTDKRPGFKARNYGICEGRAVMFDPGNVFFSEKVQLNPEREIASLEESFRSWVDQNFIPGNLSEPSPLPHSSSRADYPICR